MQSDLSISPCTLESIESLSCLPEQTFSKDSRCLVPSQRTTQARISSPPRSEACSLPDRTFSKDSRCHRNVQPPRTLHVRYHVDTYNSSENLRSEACSLPEQTFSKDSRSLVPSQRTTQARTFPIESFIYSPRIRRVSCHRCTSRAVACRYLAITGSSWRFTKRLVSA